ncbi:MAG TPA: glycosyltransferase family 39 protein [Chitinophagales bacterium]|nr:glycosyltransferase family 39 protein [Chitinophagales bacterium]
MIKISSSKNIYTYLILFITALAIRILFNSFFPYLHDWDERFHALVAKNMMSHPFTPMLRDNPVLPYNETSWTDGHIWLHKQPLFLWQMALSMKLFGVNLFALRLPSAILGALSVVFIFRIGILLKNKLAGLIAAILFSFSSYQLELTNGVIGMDHNDVAFGFYILASFWCYFEYKTSQKKYWIFLIGLFAGCAILNKWLVGLLIFSVWGIELLLLHKKQLRLKHFYPLLQSFIICCIVFIPWQIYILNQFPVLSRFEFNYNTKHLTESVEGMQTGFWYYFQIWHLQYSYFILPFIAIAFWKMKYNIRNTGWITLLVPIVIVYLFFTLITTSKGISYVFISAPFIFLLTGLGITEFFIWIKENLNLRLKNIIQVLIILFLTLAVFKPLIHQKYYFKKGGHFLNVENKDAKKFNTAYYKRLDTILPEKYVILNCKSFENIEAMFWSNQNVYQWFPNETDYLQLKEKGCKIAAFPNMKGQEFPDYIANDSDVLILDKQLK